MFSCLEKCSAAYMFAISVASALEGGDDDGGGRLDGDGSGAGGRGGGGEAATVVPVGWYQSLRLVTSVILAFSDIDTVQNKIIGSEKSVALLTS